MRPCAKLLVARCNEDVSLSRLRKGCTGLGQGEQYANNRGQTANSCQSGHHAWIGQTGHHSAILLSGSDCGAALQPPHRSPTGNGREKPSTASISTSRRLATNESVDGGLESPRSPQAKICHAEKNVLAPSESGCGTGSRPICMHVLM